MCRRSDGRALPAFDGPWPVRGKNRLIHHIFDIDALGAALRELPETAACQHFAVAFSGGADSTALLVALIQLYADQQQVSLRALHFNHRIHPEADHWQQHCESLCDHFGIEIQSGVWYQSSGKACSEGDARQARYDWLSSVLENREVLLTAHHADDQAETVLLNLLQGRGLHRLGGIPAVRPLQDFESLPLNTPDTNLRQGKLVVRPLLEFSHKALRDFLAEQEISWIDDPANHQVDHRRSFLRQEVLPVMRQQFSDCDTALINSATQFLQTNQALEQVAGDALSEISDAGSRRIFCLAPPIRLDQLGRQPGLMQPRIIRRWVHSAGLVAPTDKQLNELMRQLHRFPGDFSDPSARQSGLNGTTLRWADYRIVVHGALLYLVDQTEVDRHRVCPFSVQPAALDGHLETRLVRVSGSGLSIHCDNYNALEWRWRRGGERFHLPGAVASQSLKKLFQGIDKPGFERKQLPFLCLGEDLLWVHGLGFSDMLQRSAYRADDGEDGFEPLFRRLQRD